MNPVPIHVRRGSTAAVLTLTIAGLAGGCAGAPEPSLLAPDFAAPVRTLEPGPRFEGGLEARLRAAPAGRSFSVLVDLTRQIDYRRLAPLLKRPGVGKQERRRAVIRALERIARDQQEPVLRQIEAWIEDGTLDYCRPVAIVNRLLVEGSAEGILRLGERPEVARVMEEWTSRTARGRAVPAPRHSGLGERFESWAIEAMGVRPLWEAGLDGSGVVVAAIDTGVYEEHEQLRGRAAEHGWYDPVQGLADPYDNHGHGTSVLSAAVGGGVDGRRVGVAPGARWVMALGNWKNYYSRTRMTLAADWVLRTARPDVLVNAWSHDEGECTTFDLDFINAWTASGIFVVFPAGNAGPRPRSGDTPAQLGGAFPDGGPVFSVAGTSPDGTAFRESSRGPSRCGSPAFPSLSAPGAELPFAYPPTPDTYGHGNGTSLTAGLVGGAAALLLQADPELAPWELQRILTETAQDVPPTGRDDATGAGSLWLPAALERVRARATARQRLP